MKEMNVAESTARISKSSGVLGISLDVSSRRAKTLKKTETAPAESGTKAAPARARAFRVFGELNGSRSPRRRSSGTTKSQPSARYPKLELTVPPGIVIRVAGAEMTDNPRLAIVSVPARELAKAVMRAGSGYSALGKAAMTPLWCVFDVRSRRVLTRGLLTRDLALKTAAMLTALGFQLGKGATIPRDIRFKLDLFDAAARAMSDCYLQLA